MRWDEDELRMSDRYAPEEFGDYRDDIRHERQRQLNAALARVMEGK